MPFEFCGPTAHDFCLVLRSDRPAIDLASSWLFVVRARLFAVFQTGLVGSMAAVTSAQADGSRTAFSWTPSASYQSNDYSEGSLSLSCPPLWAV